MRVLLCMLAVMVFVSEDFVYAQKYTLQGRIVDSNRQAIEFVSLSLFVADSLVDGQVSDSVGKFVFQQTAGDYKLIVRYLGHVFLEQQISLSQDVQLGEVAIDEMKYQELNSVDVVARRKTIEQRVDRLVFHVDNVPALVGKDALEALKLAPRLHVSDKSISIAGKKGVRLMINGRISPLSGEEMLDYLKNIGSDDIQDIEIIANPPSKYSAEGAVGIINIVTKTQRKDSWTARLSGSYIQYTYPSGRLNASTNLKKGKWELSSMLSLVNGATRSVENGQYDYPTGIWTDCSENKNSYNNPFVHFAPTYQINAQLSTGFRYEYYRQSRTTTESDETNMFSAHHLLDSLIEGKGGKNDKSHHHSLNYFFLYKMDTVGTVLSLDADYFQYDMRSNRNYFYEMFLPNNHAIDGSYQRGRSFSDQQIQNYSLNLNVQQPMAWANIEYGGRLSGIETKNIFEQYKILGNVEHFDSTISNRFNYREQTYALFANVDVEVGDMYGQIGFRYEKTHTNGISPTLQESSDRKYDRFFPTVNIGYDLSEEHSLSFYYGNRINRPIYRNLNPFRWVIDTYTYSEGNPNLRPFFMDNFELSHNFEGEVLGVNSNLYYSFFSNGSGQILIIQNDFYKHFSWMNYLNGSALGLDQTYNMSFHDRWNMRIGYFLNYSKASSNSEHTQKNRSGWTSMGSLYNVIYIDKDKNLSVSINFEYYPEGIDDLDHISSHNKLDLYFTWMLLEKKLSISVYASDITGAYRPEYTTFSSGVRTSTRNYYDQQYVSLSATYKLGQNRRIQSREWKNEEERNRL